MSIWSSYPATYRKAEVQALLAAVQHGECAAVLGLSGAGKSNLLGFLTHAAQAQLPGVLVDCNRMAAPSPDGFWHLVLRALGQPDLSHTSDAWTCLESSLNTRLEEPPMSSPGPPQVPGASGGLRGLPNARLCLVLDRFDALPPPVQPVIYGRLRSLRDDHKYHLTYIIASRQPVDPHSELAELFFGHTLWLGPLTADDARWSAASYAARAGLDWDSAVLNRLIELSGAYPAFLRAVCEAHSAGCELNLSALQQHPAVRRRLEEFWLAAPSPEELRMSGLENNPLLKNRGLAEKASPPNFDTKSLTAKELRLWEYFAAHPAEVCEKDDLIRAVWPEDRVFSQGIRDDSLAQLVRRLRQKIEEDTGQAQWIQTVPGRGYLFTG